MRYSSLAPGSGESAANRGGSRSGLARNAGVERLHSGGDRCSSAYLCTRTTLVLEKFVAQGLQFFRRFFEIGLRKNFLLVL
jgi:hypothetical protein